MSICPSCGGYLPRNSERSICRECHLKREIESLRWEVGEIYRILPMHIRAKLRSQEQVYVRQANVSVSGRSTSKRLKRLYLERDALKKQVRSYRKAAIDCGVLRSGK